MIWQAPMNHGLKFLKGTLGDAQKKFGDPESLFLLSNNDLVKCTAKKPIFTLKMAKNGFLKRMPKK